MLAPAKLRRLSCPIAVLPEELIAVNHFYRHRERSLNLAFVHDLVRPAYAEMGRPFIDRSSFSSGSWLCSSKACADSGS